MDRRFAVTAIALGLASMCISSSYGQLTGTTSDLTGTGTTTGAAGMTLQDLNLGTGMTTGNERFLQTNRQVGQFVGSNFAGTGNLRGQAGLGGTTGTGTTTGQMGMMGAMNPMNPLSGLYAASMLNSLSQQRRPLRIPITLGIEPTPAIAAAVEPAHVGKRVQTQLVKIPKVRGSGAVNVEMDGRIAVIRGEVKSQHDRDLIGRMLLLEPGVSDVRNELVVAPPAPAP